MDAHLCVVSLSWSCKADSFCRNAQSLLQNDKIHAQFCLKSHFYFLPLVDVYGYNFFLFNDEKMFWTENWTRGERRNQNFQTLNEDDTWFSFWSTESLQQTFDDPFFFFHFFFSQKCVSSSCWPLIWHFHIQLVTVSLSKWFVN